MGPSSSLSQVCTSTPSRRTLPTAAGHRPTSSRPAWSCPKLMGRQPQHLARLQAERDAAQDLRWHCRAPRHELLDLQRAAGRRQRHARGRARARPTAGRRAGSRRRAKFTTERHCVTIVHQRRQHPPAQNGGHHHHAGAAAKSVVQHQPGAQPQQQGALERGLQKLGQPGSRLPGRTPVPAGPGIRAVFPSSVRWMSRSMPMDSITWALRSEPSAYCCAAIAVRLACHQRRLGVALVEPADQPLDTHGKRDGGPAQHRADGKQQHQAHHRHRRLHQRQQHR
jgi:hypothetical protein